LDGAKVYARQAWLGKEALNGYVEVEASFYGARANADADNLIKGVLDALSGTVIADDRQAVKVCGWRHADAGLPRTVVSVRPLGDSG
jgi:Holliday junction resolvase RusA-like endonuclease